LGSWLTYGLGSENQNLPAFVALVVGHDPPGSPFWSSGMLPSIFQGTHVREQEPRIMNLDPPAYLKGAPQAHQLGLLEQLNREHLNEHPDELDLQARIASYELAARMQTSAHDVFDLSGESPATRQLYGLENDATRRMAEACLIARRLVERGVRFVQIDAGSWDHHGNLAVVLKQKAGEVDGPAAALIKDLKDKGLLDSTLIIWGGEFGRTVTRDRNGNATPGRDHNGRAMVAWMAGGGVKGGMTYGSTDEFGARAVENKVHIHDLHATILALLGFDHTKLTYRYNGRDFRFTDNFGNVVKDVIA
jgi:hypothetical protein